MPDTPFRNWMTRLCQPEGNRPEWPVLLCSMLEAELLRQQEEPRTYAGAAIIIQRTEHDFQSATGEKRAVYGLYHRCLQETGGCLTIGGDCFWLLSYEVPNQRSFRMRRADLVGLTAEGGLAVFECKLGNNRYGPFAAILEGLDYLACLTSELNFTRLQDDYWKLREQLPVPDAFQAVEPTGTAQHQIIVLAPPEYYRLYDESMRGKGWRDVASNHCHPPTLQISLAVADLDPEGFYRRQIDWC